MNKAIDEKKMRYWVDRLVKQDKYIQQDLKKVEKELKKEFAKALKEIKKELSYIYVTNKGLTFSEMQMESTLKALYDVLDDLYHNEEDILNNRLIRTYSEIYKSNIDALGLELAFATINDKVIKEVVKTNWSGLTFSERLWGVHLPKLKKELKEVVQKGLIRGESLQDMARNLDKKINNGYENALRIVHTETCWIQNKATVDSYKDAGVKKYQYISFIDNRTSQVCRNLEGSIFKVSEAVAGVNLPPMHPRCRSCVVPIIE